MAHPAHPLVQDVRPESDLKRPIHLPPLFAPLQLNSQHTRHLFLEFLFSLNNKLHITTVLEFIYSLQKGTKKGIVD